MMIRSVLLVAFTLQLAQSRRLIDDIDNEVSVNPEANLIPPEQDVWVKISQPPVELVNSEFGTPVELHCEAMGSPPPTIQWYKGKMRLTENDSFESNLISSSQTLGLAKSASRLVINYVLPRHQGAYICVAQSGSKSARAVSEVIVKNKEGREMHMNFTQLIQQKILGVHHKPRITFWSPTYLDVIGSDVILPCNTVGNPKPKLKWYNQNNEQIQNLDDERFSVLADGELRIRQIEWSDMGVYKCVVQNSIGVDSAETFLYPMQQSK